ncbi:hypothetical protein [Parasynechococcus marenigrum]|uniref:hypothetical protein n=1 Tax=Parasynechococcus marenigrum TaxID=2881428 RepID=UPI0011D2B593|nr:hypothetical protein [Parasynechococcus marenigrum]
MTPGSINVSPLYQPLLNQLRDDGYTFFYWYRQTSLLNKNSARYSPWSAAIHDVAVTLDAYANKIFNSILPISFHFSFFERFLWFAILLFLRPSFVVGIEPSQELCYIARLLNISCIDVEHGLRSPDTYYYRSSYRYTSSGYPRFLLYTNIADSRLLEGLLPSYSLTLSAPCMEFLYEYNNITTRVQEKSKSNSLSILFLSQYLKRGSELAHPLPKEMLLSLKSIDIPVILKIRLHPKLIVNQETVQKLEHSFNKQINFCCANVTAEFSCAKRSSIFEDLLDSSGLITLASSGYRYAQLLSIPIMIYSELLNDFDNCDHDNGLYGFTDNPTLDEWKGFITACATFMPININQLRNIKEIHEKRLTSLISTLREAA